MSLKRFATDVIRLLLACFVAVLIIAPSLPVGASETDFNGPTLPAAWFSTAWFPGVPATVARGNLMVDGVLTGTVALYGPGHALEFVATFSGNPWQHIGLGIEAPGPGSSSVPCRVAS